MPTIGSVSSGVNGSNGTDGVGIHWLGTLKKRPTSAQENDAFYWPLAGVTCIYSDGTWQVMSRDNSYIQNECSGQGRYYDIGSPTDTVYWSQIGNQIWEVRNRQYPYPNATNCYAGVAVGCELQTGRWFMSGDFHSAMTVCPDGWHVPTLSDWEMLLNNADLNDGVADSATLVFSRFTFRKSLPSIKPMIFSKVLSALFRLFAKIMQSSA